MFYFHLAEKLGRSRVEIGQLSSLEITGWVAYFQVQDWLRKSEKEEPEGALEFARAVHGIVARRWRETGSTKLGG